MHNLDLKELSIFNEAIEKIGFKVLESYSGEVSSANNFRTRLITLQKISDCPRDTAALVQAIGGPLLRGFKFTKTDVKLKDSRKIVTDFVLKGSKKLKTTFNAGDKRVFDEEQAVLAQAQRLKKQYRSIQNIPKETIYNSGFSRIRISTGKNYLLFKSLESGEGAVIIR